MFPQIYSTRPVALLRDKNGTFIKDTPKERPFPELLTLGSPLALFRPKSGADGYESLATAKPTKPQVAAWRHEIKTGWMEAFTRHTAHHRALLPASDDPAVWQDPDRPLLPLEIQAIKKGIVAGLSAEALLALDSNLVAAPEDTLPARYDFVIERILDFALEQLSNTPHALTATYWSTFALPNNQESQFSEPAFWHSALAHGFVQNRFTTQLTSSGSKSLIGVARFHHRYGSAIAASFYAPKAAAVLPKRGFKLRSDGFELATIHAGQTSFGITHRPTLDGITLSPKEWPLILPAPTTIGSASRFLHIAGGLLNRPFAVPVDVLAAHFALTAPVLENESGSFSRASAGVFRVPESVHLLTFERAIYVKLKDTASLNETYLTSLIADAEKQIRSAHPPSHG